jgi:hypothetical protein
MTPATTPRLKRTIVATAMASVAYLVFWTVTTQVASIRAIVPFGEDPYDLIASVAIVLLPLIGGLTAVRIVRYGPSKIPEGPVAARILLGLGICLGLVSGAVVAAAIALVRTPMEADGVSPGFVLAGLAITSITTIAAWVALARAGATGTSLETGSADAEPDALDDLVAVLPLPRTWRGWADQATGSLRRHRTVAGLGAASFAAVGAVAWHSVREGAWASPGAALIYGGILMTILLVAYGLLIGPLRVLRSD